MLFHVCFSTQKNTAQHHAGLHFIYAKSISSTVRSTTRALFLAIRSPPDDVKAFCSMITSIAFFTASGSTGSTGLSKEYVTVFPSSFSNFNSIFFIVSPPFLYNFLLLTFSPDVGAVFPFDNGKFAFLQPCKRFSNRVQLVSI